ncbi:MAG: HD domain-containing protein [Alphaproteobacteria bacterium]|nr:HD domain-containing protein [Alphaproteobacteria bacterium]
MKVYQVGGCVRDEILGRTPHDIDHLVVGGTVEEMLAKGYKQVGKDFPVFLHPETQDEYALARKEIKTGDKHTDFTFIFTPDITLTEDMQRRDFTVNALAKDIETGEIIDTVGGLDDLQHKVIRHVNSQHFGEDPLRVLRMCRFAAKLDFTVAPETMQLAKDMANADMISHLTPERIWKEIEKALETSHFEKFIRVARECGALKVILPEVDKLWDTPEKVQYHPEGNSGEHTMLVIRNGEHLSPKVKFALLLHDIGKAYTPHNILPAHHKHDFRGLKIIERICRRLSVPNEFKKIAVLGCQYHMKTVLFPQMRNSTKFDFVCAVSLNFKDKNMMKNILEICRCDMLGRAKTISKEEINNFEHIVKSCEDIFEKAQNIRATDMPKFNELSKDANFAALYRDFRIKSIFGK